MKKSTKVLLFMLLIAALFLWLAKDVRGQSAVVREPLVEIYRGNQKEKVLQLPFTELADVRAVLYNAPNGKELEPRYQPILSMSEPFLIIRFVNTERLPDNGFVEVLVKDQVHTDFFVKTSKNAVKQGATPTPNPSDRQYFDILSQLLFFN